MICQQCVEFNFIENLEHYFVTSTLSRPLRYFDSHAIKNQGINFSCDNCGNQILTGDLYLSDKDDINTIKEYLFSQFAEEVMKHIQSCERCSHGQFMIGLHHSIKKIFNDKEDKPEEIFSKYNRVSSIMDLIHDVIGFDEYYYEDIANHIKCHCGNGSGINYRDKIDYSKFDLYDEVYTTEDIRYFEEAFYGHSYTQIKQEIKSIAQIYSYSDLVNLQYEFLKNPYLISQSHIFNGIYNFIKNLYHQGNYLLLYPSKRMYRARVNKDNLSHLADKMWEPPIENTRQNRYNTIGFPVLYCSNNKNALYLEVPNSGPFGYTFATLRLIKPLKMLKINQLFGYGFQGFIEEVVPVNSENNDFKIQYIITNIISSIAKDVGFNGITYLSVKDKRYINYAIFDYKKDTDIEIINIENK